MPAQIDTAPLRQHIKLALFRAAFRRGLLTEAQLDTLLQGQQTRP